MSIAIKDCCRICGAITGKCILFGVPIALVWPLPLILCAARIIHFIALER